MSAWILIIVLEIAFSVGVISYSPHHPAKLLVQKIAQAEESVPPTDPAPAPAPPPADTAPSNNPPPDNPAPAADNSSTTPAEAPSSATSTPSDQTAPSPNSVGEPSASNPAPPAGESSAPAASPTLLEQEINPSPTPSEQPSSASKTESSPSPIPSAEATITQTEAVLNSADLINSPENINTKSVDEAKKEDERLAQTISPVEQTNLLISFATDKVKDMSNFTKADDFSSANFAAQRFNEQVDQAISNLDKLLPKEQVKVKKQLTNFCNQADQILRTVQLAVPEESEQDLAIARGQCQELDL